LQLIPFVILDQSAFHVGPSFVPIVCKGLDEEEDEDEDMVHGSWGIGLGRAGLGWAWHGMTEHFITRHDITLHYTT